MSVLILSALGFATLGLNPVQAPTEILYTPVQVIKDQRITLRGWGSGTIGEDDSVAFEGANSIRVSTRNFFQGGIMTFGEPVNLARAAGNKDNLLRIVFRAADTGTPMGGGAGRGPAGGPTGVGPAGGGGGGAPTGVGPAGGGGGGAAMGSGAPGGAGMGGAGFGAATRVPLPFRFLRLIVTTTDGKKSEAYIPVSSAGSVGNRGWRTIAVPLQAISGFDRTDKVVKSVAFSADATTTFYVGDVRIVNDETPIRGEVSPRTLNREVGAEVTFTGTGTGGSSLLKYTWDFDASDGIGVDAEGQVVRRRFRKAGNYIITLTISDYFGLKTPFTTTVTARINP